MAFPSLSIRSCVLSLGLLAAASGCSDDTGGETGAGGSGGATSSTGEGTGGAGTGGAGTGGGDLCSPAINGTLQDPNATADVTLGGDANVEVTEPGTIPCSVRFDPASGISNGDGTSSGATYFECIGHRGDLFFGFLAIMFAMPVAGETYPLGSTSSVPGAEPGSFVWNGEVSFAYEEGPLCEPKTGLTKVWESALSGGTSPATGSLVVHTLEGNAITFSIEGASIPVSLVENQAGTGTIEVDAEGEGAISGL